MMFPPLETWPDFGRVFFVRRNNELTALRVSQLQIHFALCVMRLQHHVTFRRSRRFNHMEVLCLLLQPTR